MSKNKDAAYWIEQLGLTEHPEGGYFRETYRSDEVLQPGQLPNRYQAQRNIGTSIYFLLTREKVSNFHRLNSDEIWHFHTGGAARIHFISPQGQYSFQDIGSNLDKQQAFQVCISRHSWFAAEVIEEEFILVGCTVSPGFDFVDFELASFEHLVKEFPIHGGLISRFTNQDK